MKDVSFEVKPGEVVGIPSASLRAGLGMRRAEIERKFDEIVAFAEVEKFLDTPVKHYSSGMHVRLAFAVAAHRSAERSRRSLEPETCPELGEGSAGG